MAEFTDTNWRRHQLAWTRFWCAFANNKGIVDVFAYNLHAGCACLEEVHQRAERLSLAVGKDCQHATFKEARAAMSAFWSVLNRNTHFSEEGAVKAMAKGLRRVAPLKAKHADTWDIQLVFNKLFELAAQGVRVVDMEHGDMRGWTALMLKLKTAGRSGDVGFERKEDRGGLYRGFYPNKLSRDIRCGLRGDWLEGTVTDVRWYMNKTIAGRADDYSPWHPLGDYLKDSAAYPHMSAACPRRMLEEYLTKTVALPRSSDLVFISSVKKEGRYFGVTAQTIANDVGSVMSLCGVPERFKPHTTRHASLSKRSAGGDTLDRICDEANMSAKVLKHFYLRPIVKDTEQLKITKSFKGARKTKRAHTKAIGIAAAAKVTAKKAKHEPPPAAPAPQLCDGAPAKPRRSAPALRTVLAISPPPAPIAGEEYVVDCVIDVEDTGEYADCPLYRVRWVGYGEIDDSWLSKDELAGAAVKLDDFLRAREQDLAHSERRLAPRAPRRAPSLLPSSPASRSLGVLACSAGWVQGAPVPRKRKR